MEKEQADKIIKLLPDLLQVTTYNVMITAELKSRNVFSKADVSQLESFLDQLERVNKFYELLTTKTDGYVHLIHCLRITKQSRALEILGESLQVEDIPFPVNYFGSPDSPKYIQTSESVKRQLDDKTSLIKRKRLAHIIHDRIITFHVREPSKLFTGRQKELDCLKDAMTSYDSTAVITQNSITGLGGIGKTELAKKFIHSIDFTANDPLFNTIVWINAENETTTSKDFRTLATDKLGINTQNANGGEVEMQSVLEKIYQKLEHRKTLLVFDNLENPAVVEKYRPTKLQTSGDISLLITSQESGWNFGRQIRLSEMEQEDATEFVKKGLDIPDDCGPEMRNEILQLVIRLQCFPLAIDQAIAFINNRRKTRLDYGPENYVADLNANTSQFLEKHESGTEVLYKKTIYEIVKLTMDKIKCDECYGSEAIQILKMMAFMEPDNIPNTMFTHNFNEFTLDGALGLLQKYSIVNYTPSKKGSPLYVSIHCLVQDVIRMMLTASGEEENVLQQCLLQWEPEDSINEHTVDHVVSCWKFAANHTNLFKCYAGLPSRITDALTDLSRFNYAYEFATGQLELLETFLVWEQNAEILLNLELCIGFTMMSQFKLNECKEYITNTLDKATKFLSKSHPIVLKAKKNLATTMARRLEFDDALFLYEQVYREWKVKSDGAESIISTELLNYIGEIHRLVGKYQEGAKTFQRLIHESEKNEFKNYSRVALAKSSLAKCNMFLVNPSTALEEMRQACLYAEQHLHSNHPTIMQIKFNMGHCLEQSGQFMEAQELYRSVRAQLVKVFGYDFERTLMVNSAIIVCKIELGEHDDLLEKAVEVYDDFKRNHGESYYYTIFAYATVGMALYILGHYENALFIISNCLKSSGFQRAPFADARQVKFYAALCLEKLGRLREAFSYLEDLDATNSNENKYWKSKIRRVHERVKENCNE